MSMVDSLRLPRRYWRLAEAVARPDGQLHPRGEPELGEDVVDVRVHGPPRNEQPVGNVPVGQTERDERGDFLFAAGELGGVGSAKRTPRDVIAGSWRLRHTEQRPCGQ